MNKFRLQLVFFSVGLLLLAVNSISLFVPLRHPDIDTEKLTGFKNDISIDFGTATKLLENLNPADTRKYVIQVTDIFNRGIAHYWPDDGKKKYNLTIPIYENYILYILQFIYPNIYEKYEYCNYEKALERGIGLCSQQSIAITDFLNKKGVKAKIVGLDGHVLTTVLVDIEKDEWWILDPDFGVVVPQGLAEIEKNPKIVKPYYEKKLGKEEGILDKIIEIYGSSGNEIYSDAIIGNVGYIDCNWKKVLIEWLSSFLIWAIPIIFILPFIFASLSKKGFELPHCPISMI